MQLELLDIVPPTRDESAVDSFRAAITPHLVFNPHTTLSAYQDQWYAMMELAEQHAAPMLARAGCLETEAKTAGRIDRRRLMAEATRLREISHDLHILVESAWVVELHPKVEAYFDQLRPDDDAREYLCELLSNDRACECWGDTPLRLIMLHAVCS